MSSYKPIALALGGGGARGFAHIGVLRALEKEGIPIGMIVGTSMGAIVGAMYAQKQSVKAVSQKFHDLLKSPIYESSGMNYVRRKHVSESWFDQIAEYIKERIIINIAQHKRAALAKERIQETISFLLKNELIENLPLKFAAVATDLLSGQEVPITKGSVVDAVIASAALPGFLPPVELYGRLLVDGAATSPVPIQAAKKLGKLPVVAVDVSQTLSQNPRLENIIDIVTRNYAIVARHYHDLLVKEADVLVQPPVGEFHWADFDKIDWFIEEGEFAARDAMHRIKRLVHKRRLFSLTGN